MRAAIRVPVEFDLVHPFVTGRDLRHELAKLRLDPALRRGVLTLETLSESDEAGQSFLWRIAGQIVACDDLQRSVGERLFFRPVPPQERGQRGEVEPKFADAWRGEDR